VQSDARLQEVVAQNVLLEATNTHLVTTNERLTAQLSDANADLVATNARLDTANVQSDARLQEVVAQNVLLEATNARLVATNARLDTANAQSDARLQEVFAQNARLEARWSDVSATNDTLSTSIGSLTDTLSLWARNLSDEDIHHLDPLEGEDVQYLIDDVSKYKTLAVSYQRVVAVHDKDVHTFSDAKYTYIIIPYLHQNIRQILSISCDSTNIQLCYHLSPHLASVQIIDHPTDGTQVILMNGRNLFTTGGNWKLQVSSSSRQLSTLLSITWLEASDASSLGLEASTAVVLENPSSGTKLAVRMAASMLDRSDSYVFQLVHGVDSTLSSNQTSVAFVSSMPTVSD